MTQTISHQAHTVFDLRNCQTRTQVRADADTMLRDIAFVRSMTERVRDEIEADQEAQEPALV
jgi:hypothetical protein